MSRSTRTSSRTLKIFDFWFSYASLVRGGLPLASAVGKDVHSDLEAVRLFNPAHLSKSSVYDDLGAHLWQFLGNMFFASWESSKGYDTETLAKNMFTAYYLLLICTWHAWQNRGSHWPLEWLPRRTVKNLLLLGSSAQRKVQEFKQYQQ